MNGKIGAVLLALAVIAGAEVIKSPEMVPLNLGTECPTWSWKSPPAADGSYDAAGVYTLTGNGHAVYMCWDRAAFAFVAQVPLESDFTLIGRIKTKPDAAPFTVGMTIKGAADTRSNVLDIRYDSYWDEMSWFNRQTDPNKIGLHDQGERGNCQGTTCPPEWEGCLGQGYENRIPGFKGASNIWVRITRQGIKYYAWVKQDGSETWNYVKPVSAGKTGTTNTGSDLGTFKVFQTGLVYAGFTLVTVGYAEQIKTAQFDNIEIRTGADVVAPDGNTTIARSARTPLNSVKASGVSVRDGFARVSLNIPATSCMVGLFSIDGKQVARTAAQPVGRNEIGFALPRTLSTGLYQLRVYGAGVETSVPIMVH